MSHGLELGHMNIFVPINGKKDELNQPCPLLELGTGSRYHETHSYVAVDMEVDIWIKLGICD